MALKNLFTVRRPTERQWAAGLILFFACLLTDIIASRFFLPPAVIPITAGVALAGLVLEGVGLWPAIYISSVLSYLFDHAGNVQSFVLIILPIAQTLQPVIGALLLKKLMFDPMLNQMRDGLIIFFVGIAIAVITPTLGILAYSLNRYFFGTSLPPLTWESWWVGTIMSVIVGGPFLIRWLYRPFFSRSRQVVREISIVFGVLLVVNISLFFTHINQLAGISLVYLLLLPLFWIAIRLGPRFMTLAIATISVMAIASLIPKATPINISAAGQTIFQTEIFLIVIAGIFLIFTSIEEERKEALKNMRSHVTKLEDEFGAVSFRDRTKSEFLATLAHELRNPLAPLVSSLELLRLKGLVSTEELPLLDEMEDRIKTIRRLLDDTLDMSRISQNKFRLQREYTEIQKVVTSAVRSVEKNLEEREQTISVNMQKEPIRVNVDVVRIEQVVTNLLTNASKFSEKGGKHFCLRETTRRNGRDTHNRSRHRYRSHHARKDIRTFPPNRRKAHE
jgi:signal transduction histidine kinase